jgi:hypothetical protein
VSQRSNLYLIVLTPPSESLVPFDLESTWSASVVILVAHAVDPSLLRNVDELRQIAFAVLSEMVARGNRVASFYKEELELLESTGAFDTTGFATGGPSLQEWYFDDGMIDGEQLMRAADSLNVDAFQWYTDDTFEGLDASLL